MAELVPLFLPPPVVDEQQLRLENDFEYHPSQVAWDSRGRLFVACGLFYNYLRYDPKDNRSFSTYTVNVYETSLAPAFMAETSRLAVAARRGEFLSWDMHDPSLIVAADDSVALTTPANRAFFFDDELTRRLDTWDCDLADDAAAINRAGYLCDATPLGDGRYLCVVGEAGVRVKYYARNLICLTDGAPFSASSRPTLSCFACYASKLPWGKVSPATFPHVRLPGDKGERPQPSLGAQVRLHSGWLSQALPLTTDRFLVTCFHQLLRGGTKGMDFTLALVDTTGRVLGTAQGIHRDTDSPYVDHHYRVGVDRGRGTFIYKGKRSFFLFDFDGAQVARVALDEGEAKALSTWHLAGSGPDGRAVLCHRKQHLLLRLDPIAPTAAGLEESLRAGVAVLKEQRTKLKKRFESRAAHWLHPGPVRLH
jgi:hypothetical protein